VKRLASGAPVVTEAKQLALVDRVVEALFSPAYLDARGLSPEDAALHNRLVAGATAALAELWDRTAAQVNQLDPAMIPEGVAPHLAMEALLDAEVRCGAYLCFHGQLHPVIDQMGRWTGQRGLKPCLAWLRGLARRPVVNERVCQLAKISKNTWASLKEGRRIPQDDTIDRLAHALHRFELHLGTDRLTAAEIGLVLRAGCAVADLLEWGKADVRRAHAIDFHLCNLRFFRSDLRRYSQVDLAEIVAKGASSRRWPEIHGRLLLASQAFMERAMRAEEARVAAYAQDLYSPRESDRRAALHRMADDCEARMAEARRLFPLPPGADHSAQREMMRFVESMPQIFRSLAGDVPLPELPRPPCLDRVKAEDLSDIAFAPWSELTPEQRLAAHWKAVEIDPASTHARRRLADFLVHDPAHTYEGLAQYRLVLTLDEEDDTARLGLALALMGLERHQEALVELDTLVSRGKGTATIFSLRGVCLEGLGRVTEAEPAFAQARTLQPCNADALDGLARCRRALGDEAGAKKLEREAQFHRKGRLPTQ
jgi:tetratricopeptide (TPR) repeat protein